MQFKAAEAGDVPFAVILGEEELGQGQVRIKELGLREGHPEKDGVLVEMKALVEEVWQRLRKAEKAEKAIAAEGGGDENGTEAGSGGAGV